MKIRRLELFGFKSFKDKTIISFDQSITAIVGSNGCGKSNVVDALYWVMGDMSPKHLRGQQMTDVIFSGSRDTAALDMAEVTLVMERDPAVDAELPPQFQSSNEIQITRRYYRSGESEYFMNKTACRLRDIQEFFMDTGVGAKAYSIIEQGAISRLVTQKPEDRRVVIEEVAGIMKFKARKAETERKIENSKINLQRIDDILTDLQKQLGSLKRQADKAEKFRAYSEELKSLEIQMGCKEWLTRSDSRQQALLLSAELNQIKGERETSLNETRFRLDTLSEELTGLETDLTTKRALARTAELALKDLETKIATIETKRDGSNNRLNQDLRALEQLDARKIELEASLSELSVELQGAETESLRLASEVELAMEELASLKSRAEGLRENVEVSRRQLHTEELEQTRLTQQIQNFQRQLSQIGSREESLHLQLQNIESELGLRQNERQSTLSHLESAFSTRTDLEQEKNSVDERLNQLETEKAECQASRDSVREDLTVTRIRKEQLEALDRDLDGVDAASRALALHRRSQGDAESLLADAVKVPALLERAVEAVFGRNLQRVIARSMSEVSEFRSILRAGGDEKALQGRTSVWMPEITRNRIALGGEIDLGSIYLSAAPEGAPEHTETVEVPGPDGMMMTETRIIKKVPTVREFLVNHAGVVGPLKDLIKDDSTSEEPAWVNLVRDVWIVRDSATIEDIAPPLAGLPITFVTLNGDVLTKEGYLDLAPLESAPGTENVGLIQRKREISELKLKAMSLDGQLLMAQDRFDACIHSIAQEKDKFRELTARLAALNPAVEKHSTLLRHVEAQLARLSEKQTLLSEELARAAQEKQELSQKIDEITEQLAIAETRKSVTQEALESHKAELQSFLNLQREAEAKGQQLAGESKRQDQKLSELQSKRAAAEQENILSTARRQHLEDGIAAIREELTLLVQSLDESQTEKSMQTQLCDEAGNAERAARMSVEEHREKQGEALKSVEELSNDLQGVISKLHELEQSLAVNDVEARNLKDRIREQYQIALDELSDDKLKEFATPADLEVLADAEAAKKHATALRTKIDNLGRINMVAVEEYEDVSKRHEYLYIQRADLHDALTQLQDAIDRIDRESRHRFAEAFTAVNEAFKTTFPILFGGGQAELRLTTPDNLLDSGVEIVAQPPGKKLQSVTLLSGGEKALTAVSLIFGIFSIKPSPFAVLDEVDAPLDDANVNRFNMQVRRMAEKSQIIMITHHKKTMESCDAMFGVTMEQPGVSKVASAKLGELKS